MTNEQREQFVRELIIEMSSWLIECITTSDADMGESRMKKVAPKIILCANIVADAYYAALEAEKAKPQ